MQRTFNWTNITHAKKFNGRAVFICGFVGKRWHNSALLAIAGELLSQCYVSCNETDGTEKGTVNALNLMENADAMLFFVNEFTLKDSQCLLILQHACSKAIPIIMLRPPRTRLIIEMISNDDEQGPSNTTQDRRSQSKLPDLDYSILQQILQKGFEESIVYDRLEHEKSMRKIFKKLEKCIGGKAETYDVITNGDELSDTDNDKCKQLRRKQLQTRTMTLPFSPEGKFIAIGTSSLLAQTKAMKSVMPSLNKLDVKSMGENVTSTVSSSSSFTTFDEMLNYHTTQYLIFPIKDKTQAPKLINFPGDVLNNEGLVLKDHWGSDSSLEETVEIAQRVQGNINLDDFEIEYEDDAPYTEPL